MDEDARLRARLEERLRELRADYERGRQTLAELEAQAGATREALLRIDGAITVLREQLDDSSRGPTSDVGLDGQRPQAAAAV